MRAKAIAHILPVRVSMQLDCSFLIGTGQSNNVALLRNKLFAWHRASFYGTMLEEQNGYFILSPYLAMSYLAESHHAVHQSIAWDDESLPFRQAAPLFKYALENGHFAPDYKTCLDGRLGWRPHFTEPNAAADCQVIQQAALERGIDLNRWLTAALADLQRLHPHTAHRWQQLTERYPGLQRQDVDHAAAKAFDEQDWLESIGWRINDLPFYIALQLSEPAEEQSIWTMSLAVMNKSDGEQAGTVGHGGPSGQIPVKWKPRLPAEAARLSAKALQLCPNLGLASEPGQLLSELSEEQAWQFLTADSLKLAEAGIRVLLPAWWEEIKRMKPKLYARIRSEAGSAARSFTGLEQLMSFDWRLSIGDVKLSETEFAELLSSGKPLHKLGGRWMMLDANAAKEIKAILSRMGKKQGLSLRDIMELHLLEGIGEEDGVIAELAEGELPDAPDRRISIGVELNEQLAVMLGQLTNTGSIPLLEEPEGFAGALRKYQKEGFSWLAFLRRFGLGGCLADDMGLGKTIQWIAYMQHVTKVEQPDKPALLICPTSVLGNWQKELGRFAPELKVHVHYGPNRTRGEAFAAEALGANIVMTSYSLALLDEAELSSLGWSSLCLDEAQNIKNANAKQSAAIRRLDAEHRIALTGTPIENRLTELWSIFDFVNPGYLNSLSAFKQKYATAIEKNKDTAKVKEVQRLVQPFLLRRMKKDPAIMLDLPDKHEAKSYVPLTAEQAAMYDTAIQDMLSRIDTLSIMERRSLILSTLTRLKQLCDHPSLYLKEEQGNAAVSRSNKLVRLLEMVSELRDEGDRCLIFTQYVDMGHMLQQVISRELGETVQYLHGGVPKKARDAMIERFQNDSLPDDKRCSIFVLSLKAGGTGLNLTAANHVFHYDRWWNPAVENQATDRAFRIGQTKDVQVHKFISLGTIEERIDEMIESKLELTNQIVGSGENWITELSTDDLRQMFALRKSWLNES